MHPINFTYKATFRDYIGITFNRLYSSWAIWLLYFITLSTLVRPLVHHTAVKDVIGGVVTVCIIVAIFHIGLYYRCKKIYKTTTAVGEESYWLINDKGIEIKKTSSSISLGWDNVYNVTAKSNWVFLYYNSTQMLYFPKNKLAENEYWDLIHWFHKK